MEKAKQIKCFFNKKSSDHEEDIDEKKPNSLSLDKEEIKKPKTETIDFIRTLAVMEGFIMCDSLACFSLLKSCRPNRYEPVLG